MKMLKWLIIMCTLVLSGCWSSVEVNKQAFIETMYVDKSTNGEMEITLSFPLPQRLISGSAGASGGNPYAQLSSTGKTVTDAYHKMQADQSRRLSWGHTRVIVISEALAREGIGPILEFLIREPKLNINNAILVAPGKAKDVENLAPVFETFPGEIIRRFTQNKVTLNTTPKDFLETENGDMITGILTKKRRKMLSEKGKEKLWVGTGEMALFHNYKMVGTLNPSEGRGALWLRNSISRAAVTIKSPSDGKLISLLVLHAQTKIRPSKKEPYTFNVYVTAEDDISESQSNIDLSKPKNISQLERIAEKEIKNRIEAAFNVSKKVNADVFQFGEYLSWHKPKIWKKSKKDWPAIYQDKVKLNIHVDLKILRPGSENNPFWIKELHS